MATFTQSRSVHGAILSRRQFVKSGGVLVVGMAAAGDLLAAPRQTAAGAAVPANTPNSALWSSWLEIRADNTMAIHTGRVDFGQSTVTTAYRQIVADELDFPYDSITSVVMGDTDRTPDGGITAGLLALGGENLRKVSAYTRQAVLDLAAMQLGVDKSQLTVRDGVVSGGGRRLTYGQLVTGQELNLTIPVAGDTTDVRGIVVTGNPPVKPPSQYTVVGKSFTNPVTETKVRAKEQWVTEVRLPGMVHARMVHPKTLGSTLVSAGAVDKKRFPNTEVIVLGNLVGVVAPTEWEAIGAAQQVAAATTWTDWKGLPGLANLPKALRDENWNHLPPTRGKSAGDVPKALAGAAKTFTASYDVPYMKHAPIGPTVAVGDVRPDGMVYVHVHNQHPSALRGMIAKMLETPIDKVVVRSYAGAGHYGRSNGGHSGAEDEAVLLSKAVGKPVRVQWMRPEDLQWSTCNPASYSDVQIGMDADGTIVGASFEHHRPAGDDNRLTGALLAGRPVIDPPDERLHPTLSRFNSIVNDIDDPWVYDRVPHLAELGYGTFQLGEQASPIAFGLRGHAMRTPGQLQENFAREVAMSEAAALAGLDPLEFRLKHTKDARLIRVLTTLRQEAGWQTRPSPASAARSTGAQVSGQGVSAILRANTYWACACQVTVDRSTGRVKVDRYTVVVEPGIVINPLQLKRQIQGGAIMGISQALHEEMQFDESAITSRDWRSYPIATMADVPEMKVVILNQPEVGRSGGGSEAANALAMSAIAGAFFDATGKAPRRMPLRPE